MMVGSYEMMLLWCQLTGPIVAAIWAKQEGATTVSI